MPTKTYTYVATDPNGTRLTGLMEAQSIGQARDRLSKLGYKVDSVQEGAAAKRERSAFVKQVGAPLVGKVSYEAQLTFFRQLASMHKSGVSLIQSLDTLAKQTRHAKLRYVVNDIRRHVLEGRLMSEAMDKYPEVFSPLQVNLVRAGEQGGVLDRSLHQISDYLAHEVELRNLIKSATFYPKVLIVMSILIVPSANSAVNYFASASGGPRLPLINPLTNPAVLIWVIPLLVLAFLFLRIALQQPKVKFAWDLMLISLPYLGHTLRILCMAKFGRAFAALYASGVPIARAIQLSADACGNEYIRWRIHPAAMRIQEGEGIADSFRKTRAFTQMALDMCYTGEQTDNLDGMFYNVADQYEDEAKVRVRKTSHIFAVLVLITVAMFIGYIVISFYLNYVSLIESAG